MVFSISLNGKSIFPTILGHTLFNDIHLCSTHYFHALFSVFETHQGTKELKIFPSALLAYILEVVITLIFAFLFSPPIIHPNPSANLGFPFKHHVYSNHYFQFHSHHCSSSHYFPGEPIRFLSLYSVISLQQSDKFFKIEATNSTLLVKALQ